ncbi:MAG: bifunctional 4-hydroxy-2-oxoglutarate aldolase/2-dehydro-3-deoxy-phosphogluconate aldolase [Phycisphaerae bacterium]|nr:bifunctional 4-hydroxy-2-oxoglutarate aldolase/2-dehydro-3-deoxy-phosphogluconate aldolase [Phycisphaerae bacterium]
MTAGSNITDRICDIGVVPVFRTDRTDRLLPAAKAYHEGGMHVIEFTMTMPEALASIEKGRSELPDDATLGAGTVLDAETARLAILAGAQFIVSPGLAPKVVEMCHRYGVPVVPGAMTPSEIMQALELGVDVIKVFPANIGLPYFADLVAPFPQVRFMAAGGPIPPELAKQYYAAGASVVTVAGQGLDKEAFETGDFGKLTAVVRKYLADLRA